MAQKRYRWRGQSEKEYIYAIYERDADWNDVPGNYIFAKETSPGTWTAVYVGETMSFKNRPMSNHPETACALRNGATHIHAHTNANAIDRRSEEQDLINRHTPPCNG